MDTLELSDKLQEMGVRKHDFSIGIDRDESLVLICSSGKWIVYFSERGERVDEKTFALESDACQEVIAAFQFEIDYFTKRD